MIRLAFTAFVVLLFANTATACSCPLIEPAGFVHANLKRLPANARGALFLTPQGDPPAEVSEKDFVMTSNKQAGKLKVTLTYPDIAIHAQRLVRVGPREGFKPAATYTTVTLARAASGTTLLRSSSSSTLASSM